MEKASSEEYQKRCDDVFKDLRVWGDVRKYVPTDFELTDQCLKKAKETEEISSFVDALGNATNVKEATKNIAENYDPKKLYHAIQTLRGVEQGPKSAVKQATDQKVQVNAVAPAQSTLDR